MTPEPPIGATRFEPRGYSILRGMCWALGLGLLGFGVTLFIPPAFWTVRSFVVGAPRAGWNGVPWEARLEWMHPAYAAANAGWIVGLGAFLHFAPVHRSGLLRSTCLAAVSLFAAHLVVGCILPPFTSADIDPDFRLRVAALVGISLTLAILAQQRGVTSKELVQQVD